MFGPPAADLTEGQCGLVWVTDEAEERPLCILVFIVCNPNVHGAFKQNVF